MSLIRLKFPDVIVADQVHSFPHLCPFVHTTFGHGPENSNINLRVSFKSHVFSKKMDGFDQNFDFRDENGKGRLLCLERMGASYALPDVCKRMIDLKYHSWISKDRNEASNFAVFDGILRQGSQNCLFFVLYPSQVEGIHVELVVKSAYSTPLKPHKNVRKFSVLQLIKKCVWEQKPLP
jgi:hypothetical protein